MRGQNEQKKGGSAQSRLYRFTAYGRTAAVGHT